MSCSPGTSLEQYSSKDVSLGVAASRAYHRAVSNSWLASVIASPRLLRRKGRVSRNQLLINRHF